MATLTCYRASDRRLRGPRDSVDRIPFHCFLYAYMPHNSSTSSLTFQTQTGYLSGSTSPSLSSSSSASGSSPNPHDGSFLVDATNKPAPTFSGSTAATPTTTQTKAYGSTSRTTPGVSLSVVGVGRVSSLIQSSSGSLSRRLVSLLGSRLGACSSFFLMRVSLRRICNSQTRS